MFGAGAMSSVHEAKLFGISMKWVSLVSLTVQTSAQVFIIKWARSSSARAASGGLEYLPTTIVLFTELVKLAVSFLLVVHQEGGIRPACSAVRRRLSGSPSETLKVCVPSLLYTVQNNLMFVSLARLSAAVQQVTYQLKIFTTALLSVIILGKVLSPQRWLSLVLLIIGVSLVQWPQSATNGAPAQSIPPLGTALSPVGELEGLFREYSDAAIGFAAVLTACFTSGFASVFLEKLLKQTSASVWEKNVQLGAFGSAMALFAALWQDGDKILAHGLTQGYSWRVVFVILNNALGGLLCAAVLKYADNILRCFSTALSIILTCMLSALVLQDYEPDTRFVAGTCLAIFATFFYNLGPMFFERKSNGHVEFSQAKPNGATTNGNHKAEETDKSKPDKIEARGPRSSGRVMTPRERPGSSAENECRQRSASENK